MKPSVVIMALFVLTVFSFIQPAKAADGCVYTLSSASDSIELLIASSSMFDAISITHDVGRTKIPDWQLDMLMEFTNLFVSAYKVDSWDKVFRLILRNIYAPDSGYVLTDELAFAVGNVWRYIAIDRDRGVLPSTIEILNENVTWVEDLSTGGLTLLLQTIEGETPEVDSIQVVLWDGFNELPCNNGSQ